MYSVKYVSNGKSVSGKKVFNTRYEAINAAKATAVWMKQNGIRGYATVVANVVD